MALLASAFGCSETGGGQLGGTITRLRDAPARMSNAELAALTA